MTLPPPDDMAGGIKKVFVADGLSIASRADTDTPTVSIIMNICGDHFAYSVPSNVARQIAASLLNRADEADVYAGIDPDTNLGPDLEQNP